MEDHHACIINPTSRACTFVQSIRLTSSIHVTPATRTKHKQAVSRAAMLRRLGRWRSGSGNGEEQEEQKGASPNGSGGSSPNGNGGAGGRRGVGPLRPAADPSSVSPTCMAGMRAAGRE